MAKSLQIQEADGAPVRNRSKARRIIGIALIVLVVAFALISTVSMHQRAEAADEAAKPLLQRALQNNLIVCAGFLIVGIGIAFDTLTGARNVVVRVIGYIIWAAGIMVATEAVLLCGTVLLGNSDRSIPRDTRYVMVVGTALEENSAIPGELSTRLETAGNWWKKHPETTLIVTGSGKASKSSAKKNALAGLEVTARKSDVDLIGMALTGKGIPEETILKVGRSDSAEQGFENLLKQDGIETDTPIAVIIDSYDMGRMARIAEEAGFTNVTAVPRPSGFWEFGTDLLWKTWNVYDPAVKQAGAGEA